MSAIGDYVHLHAKNYNEYGIAHKGESPSFMNYGQQIQSVHSRMKYSKLGDETALLQSAINKILSPEDNSGDPASKIREFVYEKMWERFGEALGQINWETGNVTAATKTAQGAVKSKIDADLKEHSVQVKTILSRVQALEAIKNQIGDVKKKEELKKKIDDIYHLLSDILREGSYGVVGQLRDIVGKSGSGNIDFSNGSTVTNKLISGEDTETVVTMINSALKQYAATPPINLEKGDLFEYIIALAPAVAGKAAATELEELFKGVAGGSRSKNKIDLNNWSGDIDFGSLAFDHMAATENGKVFVAYAPTQDKIDINLQWGTDIIPISAKNVSLKSGNDVHIVSGTNLLYLIQDEGDFTTHYMNVIAQHNDGQVNNLQSAHEAMKLTLLYKALTGDTYGHDQAAEVFLVNDNSQPGGVRIFEMKDLIQKASQYVDDFAKIEPALESLSLRNRYREEGYGPRITDLVSQLHQIKISVSIKASALSSGL